MEALRAFAWLSTRFLDAALFKVAHHDGHLRSLGRLGDEVEILEEGVGRCGPHGGGGGLGEHLDGGGLLSRRGGRGRSRGSVHCGCWC